MFRTCLRTLVALGVLALATAAHAEDAYYRVRLGDLKITEGTLPQPPSMPDWRHWQRAWAMLPYAVLDGGGEAYVNSGDATMRFSPWSMPQLDRERGSDPHPQLPGRRRDRAAVLSQAGLERDGGLKFTIPATAAKAEAREPFYRAKEAYYAG